MPRAECKESLMIELGARRAMVYGMGGEVVISELNSSALDRTNKRDERVFLGEFLRKTLFTETASEKTRA